MSDDSRPASGPQPVPHLQPALETQPEMQFVPEAQSTDSAQWPPTLRYGVGIVLIAICVAGLLLILPLLQLILLSFLIAFLMFIPSRALSRRSRLPYGLSVVVSFLVASAIVLGLALILLPEIRNLTANMMASLQQTYAQLLTPPENSVPPTTLQVAGITFTASDLSSFLLQVLPQDVSALLADLAHVAFGVFGHLAGLVAAIGTASVVALFFLIGLPISGGTMTNWIPVPYRREIALLFGKLDVLWLKFFRALVIIGLITAAASLALFMLFGISGPLMLAVATATIGMIPVVGRIFAILLIFLAALVNGSTRFPGLDHLAFAVLTIIAYLVMTQAIGTIVSPKLKGSAINVPVVAIVIGVMVGLTIAGIVGALLVAPIIGSLRVFMQYAIAKILLHEPYPGEEVLPLQEEGFFSHMLYVKKHTAAAGDEA